jgi:hypothetical protein
VGLIAGLDTVETALLNTELLVERKFTGQTEVLGRNLTQCHFIHLVVESNPGRYDGRPNTNWRNILSTSGIEVRCPTTST